MTAKDGQELKAQQVQKALKGLDVVYGSHSSSTVVNMARVNDYSIVWHEYAYCAGEPNTVEVMLPGGEIEGHYPIRKLRKLVSP